jgi:hypothetical protein
MNRTVERMRSVAEAVQEDHRRAVSAPIEHFECDSGLDADEYTRMRRWIRPLLYSAARRRDENGEDNR